MIAHRPSAIAGVDLLMVMAGGRMQAFGPKEEVRRKDDAAGACTSAGGAESCDRAWRNAVVNADRSTMQSSLRRLVLSVGIVAILLVLGLGGWAATTEFAGAVIAQGQLVVDSNVKKVQHPTGGVVRELLVKEGTVKAGRSSCASTIRRRARTSPS